MTEQEILDDITVECGNCGDCHSLRDWEDFGVNSGQGLDMNAEDPEGVIDDVMMDCPSCEGFVYLSDGGIV